jgi:hypothetical protein
MLTICVVTRESHVGYSYKQCCFLSHRSYLPAAPWGRAATSGSAPTRRCRPGSAWRRRAQRRGAAGPGRISCSGAARGGARALVRHHPPQHRRLEKPANRLKPGIDRSRTDRKHRESTPFHASASRSCTSSKITAPTKPLETST